MTLDLLPVVEEILTEGTFSVERFVDSFPVLVEAKGGTSELHRMVIDLAVRGRLSQRRLNEQSVALGTNSMADAASRRARTASLPPLGSEEAPYAIPKNWVWGRVNDTGAYINGLAFKPSDWGVRGRPIIRIQNLTDRAADFNRTEKSFPDDYIVRPGDLLVSWSATLNVFVWDREEGVLNQHIFRVVPNPDTVHPRFLYHALRERIQALAESDYAHGLVMKHINRGPFLAFPFALPPLPEQRRIVARVDQFMAVIDELEAKQNRKREVGARFTKASLEALTKAEGPEQFDAGWKRVIENWEVMLDQPEKVAEVRRAVLELTAQGRLVRQDKGDGTAQALIEQCPVRQRELERAGRFKTAERLQPPSAVDRSMEVPASWRWERLGNLSRFIDYRGKTPAKLATGIRLITAKNVRMGFVRTDPEEFISEKAYVEWMTRGLPAKGDLLFTTEAPLGNVAVFDFSERIALAQRIIALHPYCDLDSRFLMLVMMSPWFQGLLSEKATGMTATGIKASRLKQLAVPLAPLAEQKRIVATVDHLMKLCDDLEAKLRRAEDRASKLVEAAVQEMVA
jgi:type I restriction enzyme S subunit